MFRRLFLLCLFLAASIFSYLWAADEDYESLKPENKRLRSEPSALSTSQLARFTESAGIEPVVSWVHSESEGASSMVFTVQMPESQDIEIDGVMQRFRGEIKATSEMPLPHQIQRCSCDDELGCTHFEINPEEKKLREFVKVFIIDAGKEVVISERKFYKAYDMIFSDDLVTTEIAETKEGFVRKSQRVEKLFFRLLLEEGKSRDFKQKRVVEVVEEPLIVSHFGFNDLGWEESYSHQIVDLHLEDRPEVAIAQKISKIKIPHGEHVEYVHDDSHHSSKKMVYQSYKGKNNPLLYDKKSIDQEELLSPTCVEETVIHTVMLSQGKSKKKVYERPDGTTYS